MTGRADQASVGGGRPAEAPTAAPSDRTGHPVLVVGTFDTKGLELDYICDCIGAHGVGTRRVDLATSGQPSTVDVPPDQVAACHPDGPSAVFTGDRGTAVGAMAVAFEHWIEGQQGVAGIIAAGGSGGTALVTPGMRRLAIGIPKVMISTVAAGDVKQYVGGSDIMMAYSVTDVQGLNRISRRVLANGAGAIAGMVKGTGLTVRQLAPVEERPPIGLTMFGVTTPCVQQVSQGLENRFDCLVFHATGTGGQSMEALVDSGMLAGVLDLTTTEVCDLLVGGVFPAHEDRFGAIVRAGIPYVGSCGALDMVNFGAPATVPPAFRNRNLCEHNPQVTLMRTTAEENQQIGRWIGERLNQMTGAVRFFLPEGGVSLIDRPGQPFHDPEADAALFAALEATVAQNDRRRLIRLPHDINDPAFAAVVVDAFLEIAGDRASGASARG
jgi:uncharacterized protein (UPF0261 family)